MCETNNKAFFFFAKIDRQAGNRTFTCTFPSSLVFNAPDLTPTSIYADKKQDKSCALNV